VLFDHPTVAALSTLISRHVHAELPPPAAREKEPLPPLAPPTVPSEARRAAMEIAVVGMAGRFPGAANVREFWNNLRSGVDSVTEVPSDRWDVSRFYSSDPNQVGVSYSRWGGFLDGVDQFDPAFFRLSRAEAETMDPQQRLFLQACWEALEDAGYAGPAVRGLNCGVFAGVFNNDYQILLARSGQNEHLGQTMLGNADSILASRISYFLDLKGPALCVDSACSSSLVAIHLACRSLADGE
jgi:acyl transferase domain-containing protein